VKNKEIGMIILSGNINEIGIINSSNSEMENILEVNRVDMIG